MVYDYNCLMVETPIPGWESWSRIINPADVYTDPNSNRRFGLETEPHVTILYGIHKEISLKKLRKLNLYPVSDLYIEITGISLFQNDEYDVLKFDIESHQLREINKEIKKKFPYTTEFEVYKPHLTIGYLKPGCGENYTKVYGNKSSVPIKATNYLYSLTDGTIHKFKVKAGVI